MLSCVPVADTYDRAAMAAFSAGNLLESQREVGLSRGRLTVWRRATHACASNHPKNQSKHAPHAEGMKRVALT